MIEFKNVTVEDHELNEQIEDLNSKVFDFYTKTTGELHDLASRYKGAPVDFIAMMDDGKFVGYAYLINFFQASFLLYIAVVPECQSMGYGTAMLKHLREMKGEKPIVLTSEVSKSDADEKQYLMRKWFYIKNGYVDQHIPYPSKRLHDYDVYMNGFGIGYTELMAAMDKVNMFLLSPLLYSGFGWK